MEDMRVSFIIPTYNSERTIEKCLKSIRRQKNVDVEIIVVDGYSRDKTVDIAEKYADRIIRARGTLGFARMLGAKYASGEILGIFDSDTYLPRENWLKKAVEWFHRDEKIGIVWPINIPPPKASFTAKAYFSVWLYKLLNTKKPVPGGNILVRAKAYREVEKQLNPRLHFGEDFDLTVKIIDKGYRVAVHWDPIIHDTMYNLKQYTRKQFWGSSLLRTDVPRRLVLQVITWEYEPKETNILLASLKHSLAFISAIPIGIRIHKDPKLLFTPVLMVIRVIVYGMKMISRIIG